VVCIGIIPHQDETALPPRQVGKIKNLVRRNLFRDAFRLSNIANGVGGERHVDLAVRRFGFPVVIVDLRDQIFIFDSDEAF
jgi:hypothetical protein